MAERANNLNFIYLCTMPQQEEKLNFTYRCSMAQREWKVELYLPLFNGTA